MDDAALDALRKAHEASPENLPLLVLLVRALTDAKRTEEACRLLDGRDLSAAEGEERLTLARAALAGGRFERAVELADADEPPALLLRSRALLEADRPEEGRECYRRAIEENPALEDPKLEALLSSQLSTRRSGGGGDGTGEGDDDGGGKVVRLLAGGAPESDEEVDELLEPEREVVTFEDVGGLEHVKKQVHRRIVLPFKKPSLFQRFKRKAGGGLLLYGPPGCGKTLLARAVAGECEAQFFNVAISDVLDMWLGESERKLHALFEKARQSAPSVLFFDEVEGLGASRRQAGSDAGAKLVSTFLSEMDGYSRDNRAVLVIGATNVPWNVDSAFRRPGRFDRFLFVPPPDREARERVLEIHVAGRPGAETVDLKEIAKKTSGFSGADLEELVNTACDLAIEESLERDREVPLGQSHLRAALAELRPTTLEWLTTARNHARYANEGGQYDEVLAFLDRHGRER